MALFSENFSRLLNDGDLLKSQQFTARFGWRLISLNYIHVEAQSKERLNLIAVHEQDAPGKKPVSLSTRKARSGTGLSTGFLAAARLCLYLV